MRVPPLLKNEFVPGESERRQVIYTEESHFLGFRACLEHAAGFLGSVGGHNHGMTSLGIQAQQAAYLNL